MKSRDLTFLVTGGAGFIGSHLIDYLLLRGGEVWGFDNLSTGKISNIEHQIGNRRFKLILGDIRDRNLVSESVKMARVVFHEAALTSVPKSVELPEAVNDVNVAGTLNVLEACRRFDCERLIFASSSAIYGEPDSVPVREDARPRPTSPYAVSKLSAEQYCQVFRKLYGLKTVCLRYFNVYGTRQSASEEGGVIPAFIERITKHKRPTIFGDGNQTRDFVSIVDVIEANALALERDEATGEIINIGSGISTSIKSLAEEIAELAGTKGISPESANERPGDIKHSQADISRARRVLGYEPKRGLVESLRELIDWYRGLSAQETGA